MQLKSAFEDSVGSWTWVENSLNELNLPYSRIEKEIQNIIFLDIPKVLFQKQSLGYLTIGP